MEAAGQAKVARRLQQAAPHHTHACAHPVCPPPHSTPRPQARQGSLEAALLSRAASAHTLCSAAAPDSPGAQRPSSGPARPAPVRAIFSAGSPRAAVPVARTRSLPVGPEAPGALAASSGCRLELLSSPDDGLLGCSIVRVRLGSAPNGGAGSSCGGGLGAPGSAPLERCNSLPPAGLGTAAAAARCAWRPSAALAAAAAGKDSPMPGGGPGAACHAAPARHQGLQPLQRRRAALEEALGSGWATAQPLGLELVAEEPQA
jgi:hypothetical protein